MKTIVFTLSRKINHHILSNDLPNILSRYDNVNKLGLIFKRFGRKFPVLSRNFSTSIPQASTDESSNRQIIATHDDENDDSSLCEKNLEIYIAQYSKIATDPIAQRRQVKQEPEKFDDSKLLNVAIIGKTNAGKSVLTNALVGLPISAASKRCHTTRRNVRGISVSGKNQLIFVDTPGFLTDNVKRKDVEDELATDQENSLREAEMILVLHDVSNEFTRKRLDARIQYLLYSYRHIPSILVLNKMDLIKNKTLALDVITRLTKNIVNGVRLTQSTLPVFKDANEDDHRLKVKNDKMLEKVMEDYKSRLSEENSPANDEKIRGGNSKTAEQICDENRLHGTSSLRELWSDVDWTSLEKMTAKPLHQIPRSQLKKCFLRETGWPLFQAVFSISALTGAGVENLKQFLLDRAKTNVWRYNSKVVSPLGNVTLVKENVRGKMMEYVDHHIPYTLRFKVESWEVNEHDTLGILMTVVCEHEKHVPIVIGYKSRRITQISKECSQDLSNLFGVDVYVKFNVIVQAPKSRHK